MTQQITEIQTTATIKHLDGTFRQSATVGSNGITLIEHTGGLVCNLYTVRGLYCTVQCTVIQWSAPIPDVVNGVDIGVDVPVEKYTVQTDTSALKKRLVKKSARTLQD